MTCWLFSWKLLARTAAGKGRSAAVMRMRAGSEGYGVEGSTEVGG